MRVEVQLKLDSALELQFGVTQAKEVTPATTELFNELTDLGFHLSPTHPGQTHPLLATFFWLEVPDEPTAQRIVTRLMKLNAVEGAYIRPQEEPPQKAARNKTKQRKAHHDV